MVKQFFNKIIGLIYIPRTYFTRKFYWNLQSKKLFRNYDNSTKDHSTIRQIIKKNKFNEIFEVGCGPGRNLPLYLELSNTRIVLTDISNICIEIAKTKAGKCGIEFYINDLLTDNLIKPQSRNNICIVNKVLGSFTDKEVLVVLHKLIATYDYIYLCELDARYKSHYLWHTHNYEEILKNMPVRIIVRSESFLLLKSKMNETFIG